MYHDDIIKGKQRQNERLKAELDRQHELDKIAAQKMADEMKLELENKIKQLEQGMKEKDAALQRKLEEADEHVVNLQGVCKSLILFCQCYFQYGLLVNVSTVKQIAPCLLRVLLI
jgi:hypothetical protein